MRALPVLLLICSAVSAETIATFPPGTNLENIAVAANGDLYVTSSDAGEILQVSSNGAARTFSSVPAFATGIGFDSDGTLVAISNTSLYGFSGSGAALLVVTVPGASSLNGLTLLAPNRFLIADDSAGTIWEVNRLTGNTSAWLSNSLLRAPADGIPIGANGIKIFNGAAYVTNTGSGQVIKIPILPDGSAGSPSVYASGLSLDDLAIGSDGSLFLATQVENSVIRVLPDGTRQTIATEADGLIGDSAVAFGRTAADAQDLYIISNGGLYEDLPDGPASANIVRLPVGVTGVIPDLQPAPEPACWGCIALGLSGMWLFRLRSRNSKPV